MLTDEQPLFVVTHLRGRSRLTPCPRCVRVCPPPVPPSPTCDHRAWHRTSEKQRQQQHIQGVHTAEKERNRARVQEIMHLKTHFGEELDALEEEYNNAADQDDDY